MFVALYKKSWKFYKGKSQSIFYFNNESNQENITLKQRKYSSWKLKLQLK